MTAPFIMKKRDKYVLVVMLFLIVMVYVLQYFYKKYNYNKIAYYGMGTLGDIFINQTISEGFPICCVIDKRADRLGSILPGIKIVKPEEIESYKDVDAVIICNTYDHNSIADELIKNGLEERQILSINDVVFAI